MNGGEGAQFDWPGTSLHDYVITWTGDVMLLGRDGYDDLLTATHVECMGDTTDHYGCTMAGWMEPIITEA